VIGKRPAVNLFACRCSAIGTSYPYEARRTAIARGGTPFEQFVDLMDRPVLDVSGCPLIVGSGQPKQLVKGRGGYRAVHVLVPSTVTLRQGQKKQRSRLHALTSDIRSYLSILVGSVRWRTLMEEGARRSDACACALEERVKPGGRVSPAAPEWRI
jgi:hypothetical protein